MPRTEYECHCPPASCKLSSQASSHFCHEIQCWLGLYVWGKDTGDISATNIFTRFVKSATSTRIKLIELNEAEYTRQIVAHHKGGRTKLLMWQDLCEEEEMLLWKYFKGKKLQKELISLSFFHELDPKCFYRKCERSLGLVGKQLHPTLFTPILTPRPTNEYPVFPRLSHPLLVSQMLQVLSHLRGPLLDLLQYVHVLPVRGSPEQDTAVQMWPCQYWEKGKGHLAWPTGTALAM